MDVITGPKVLVYIKFHIEKILNAKILKITSMATFGSLDIVFPDH